MSEKDDYESNKADEEEEEEEEEEEDALDEEDQDIMQDEGEEEGEEDAEQREIRTARMNALRKLQEQNGVDGNLSAEKQLSYLMNQSEVFAHFLAEGDSENANSDKRKSKKKSMGGLGGGVGRTRMSEEAEDKNMMKQAQSKEREVTRVSQQPQTIVGGTMRSYQIEGLSWMVKLHDNCVNGILADEMGLGKTLQTISLFAYLNEVRGQPGPHLVVVPKSTVGNWMREFKKWCPTLRAVKLLGSKEERRNIINSELKVCGKKQSVSVAKTASVQTQAKQVASSIHFNVLITSYEACMREKSSILKIRWKYLVIDEAHRIKNEKSSLSKITRLFKVDNRLLVTGTPLQNNLHELWALLNFLMPEVFSSSGMFDSWFNTSDEEGKENVIKRLHTVLKPFMIRRVKADVEKDLPPKREIKLFIGLSAMQKEWYKRVLTKDIAALNALGGPDKTRLLNVLMQLRKVCNHPYLFEGAEKGPPYIDGPHIWESSGKMILLDKLLTRLKACGSRVLIFSQMTRMLDILEDYVRYKQYNYCRIDGNTSGEIREEMMDDFQAEGSSKFVFLLSTRAGGLGINLTAADIVILYDSDFNPQMDLQAMDRAHRIGQKKEVRVFRFLTEGTVEEKIIERADRKLFLDAAVIQQGRLTEQMSKNMSKTELMSMVKFGADAILSSQGGDYTDEDIDTLLARGEEKTEEIKGKLQTEVQHTLANFSVQMEDSSKSMNVFEFNGESFLSGEEGEGKKKMSLGLSLGTRERRRSSYDTINYAEDFDIEGSGGNGGNSTGPKKLNKKNAFALPDYQFFEKSRLDEIFTLEAELSLARTEQMKTIKKLRHEAEVEARRLERRSKRVEGEETGDLRSELLAKSEATLEADRLEAELGSEPFPNQNSLAQEIQFYHERAEERRQKGLEEISVEDDIISGKFNISRDMQREKERLILAGFPKWSKADQRAFVNGMERYGRNDLSRVASFMKKSIENRKGTIPEAEVRRYAKTFWSRYEELPEWQTFLRKVEKGDKRAARLDTIRQSLEDRVKRYFEDEGLVASVNSDGLIDISSIPIDDSSFKMYYASSGRGRYYSIKEDRCIVLTAYRLGYGDSPQEWEDFRRELCSRPEFRFDYFIRSRTGGELQRRCDFLVRLIEKDNLRWLEMKEKAATEAAKEEHTGQSKNKDKASNGKREDTSPSVPKSTTTSQSSSKSTKKKKTKNVITADAVEDKEYKTTKRRKLSHNSNDTNSVQDSFSINKPLTTTEALAQAMDMSRNGENGMNSQHVDNGNGLTEQ